MIDCTFENGNKASLRHCVVDVIVIKDGKILLVKRAPKLLNGGKYALVGGYIDRDENSTETCKREVKEETGYEIELKFLLRIGDNPDRPQEDRQNIVFVYVAEATQKVGQGDEEATEVKWFDLNSLPEKEEFAFDHYEDIQLYKKYISEKFQLPIMGKI
jgi:ADP-ribose pyrophosphatase YjhB (NUDIX family)